MNTKVAELTSGSGEAAILKLQDEIKDCKAILKCGVCFDRPKEVCLSLYRHLVVFLPISKLFHQFSPPFGICHLLLHIRVMPFLCYIQSIFTINMQCEFLDVNLAAQRTFASILFLLRLNARAMDVTCILFDRW